MPIVLFGNLGIQNGFVLPNVFPLFLPDFLFDVGIVCFRRVVQYIKIDAVSFALRFGKNTVFLFCLSSDRNIMLRYAFQHIAAFADVNNGIVNLDAVNSRR